MSVVVLVPRRPDGGRRDELWGHVARRWASQHPWPKFVGLHTDGPFSRSAALNSAADAAGRWEVAVIADADTLVPAAQVRDAVDLAAESGQLVIAHTLYRSLTAAGSRDVLAGRVAAEVARAKWTKDRSVSGCIVVPRPLWDAVGGFDPRFRGWGFEDRAFFIAAHALGGGHHRISGSVSHLWHRQSGDRAPRSPDLLAGRALAGRYRAARGDAASIRMLLDERR